MKRPRLLHLQTATSRRALIMMNVSSAMTTSSVTNVQNNNTNNNNSRGFSTTTPGSRRRPSNASDSETDGEITSRRRRQRGRQLQQRQQNQHQQHDENEVSNEDGVDWEAAEENSALSPDDYDDDYDDDLTSSSFLDEEEFTTLSGAAASINHLHLSGTTSAASAPVSFHTAASPTSTATAAAPSPLFARTLVRSGLHHRHGNSHASSHQMANDSEEGGSGSPHNKYRKHQLSSSSSRGRSNTNGSMASILSSSGPYQPHSSKPLSLSSSRTCGKGVQTVLLFVGLGYLALLQGRALGFMSQK